MLLLGFFIGLVIGLGLGICFEAERTAVMLRKSGLLKYMDRRSE